MSGWYLCFIQSAVGGIGGIGLHDQSHRQNHDRGRMEGRLVNGSGDTSQRIFFNFFTLIWARNAADLRSGTDNGCGKVTDENIFMK